MPPSQTHYASGTASQFGRRSLSNTGVFTKAYVTLFYKNFCSGAVFRTLTYSTDVPISPGIRVKVPLGSREVIGLCAGKANRPEALDIIKSVISVIDDEPIISMQHQALVGFASDYYFAPPGDLLLSSLPTTLRKGKPIPKPKTETGHNNSPTYQLTHDQHHAIEAVDQTANQFQCFLLQGVTGSGKTQVFLN